VPADVHDVLDQTLDRLVFTQFPFETLAKRVNDGLGERLTGTLRQRSREPIGVRVFVPRRLACPRRSTPLIDELFYRGNALAVLGACFVSRTPGPSPFSSMTRSACCWQSESLGNLASFCQIKCECYSALSVAPMNGLSIALPTTYRLLFFVSRTPIPAISSSLMKRIPAFSKAP
jgi:hypothetical protein